MSETDSVNIVTTTTLHGNFTLNDVPNALLAKTIKDSTIFVDVLNAGPMAGTGLTHQEATDLGLNKNHWWWRVQFNVSEGEEDMIWQIEFGMNIKPVPSAGSMEGQYVGSNRIGVSDSSEVYSDIGSVNKPPALGSEGGVPEALLSAAAASGKGSGNNGSGGAQSAVFSDAGSQKVPPKIASSDGGVVQQPTEGAPFPGVFDIKVRKRSIPSHATLVVFGFNLTVGTTFGQLLSALTSRNMEPFRFRKLGSFYLGCRDFISQAAAAWLDEGIMVTGEGVTVVGHQMPVMHIYELLGWRFTRPLVPANISDTDDSTTTRGTRRSPNKIDRAVWPANYVHRGDARLQYNQASNV